MKIYVPVLFSLNNKKDKFAFGAFVVPTPPSYLYYTNDVMFIVRIKHYNKWYSIN